MLGYRKYHYCGRKCLPLLDLWLCVCVVGERGGASGFIQRNAIGAPCGVMQIDEISKFDLKH